MHVEGKQTHYGVMAAKEKSQPLTVSQRRLLVSLVSKHQDVLSDKTHSTLSVVRKARVWQEIYEEFMKANLEDPRTVVQLKRAWEYLKKKAKKEHSGQKRGSIRIGGGPIPGNYEPTTSKTLSHDQGAVNHIWDTDDSKCALNSGLNAACISVDDEGYATTPNMHVEEHYEDEHSEEERGFDTITPDGFRATSSPQALGSPSSAPLSRPPSEASHPKASSWCSESQQKYLERMTFQESYYQDPADSKSRKYSLDLRMQELQLKSLEIDIELKELQKKVLKADLENKELENKMKKCHLEKLLLEKNREQKKANTLKITMALEQFKELSEHIKDARSLIEELAVQNGEKLHDVDTPRISVKDEPVDVSDLERFEETSADGLPTLS